MDCFRLRQGFGGQVVAAAPRNDGLGTGNDSFTIPIDQMFTTFMRSAFTNARDAARDMCAIA
ncbi:hypothetical protein CK489_37935 [Bradyrhizobium sp. UFLA03-84]|nr:hypothetical protein CK489_37935 [Bradyrhizobium sp. UFLA03-84]